MHFIGDGGDFGFYLDTEARKANVQHAVLCNWGMTLKQSSAVHYLSRLSGIQALVSADGILPGFSSKHRFLVINLASVPGGQLVNSPTTTKPRPLPAIVNATPSNHINSDFTF